MKLKYLEDTLSVLQPQCKSEKDLRLVKHFLLHFTAFLAAFAKSEEGQKIILVTMRLLSHTETEARVRVRALHAGQHHARRQRDAANEHSREPQPAVPAQRVVHAVEQVALPVD